MHPPPGTRRRLRRWALLGLAAALVTASVRPSTGHATVEEQRARLPPAADCSDPVAGVWKSHAYYPGHGQWYIFTLTIRRGEGAALEGTVHSHYWAGGPGDEEPPPCRLGGYHQTVIMPGKGEAQDLRIQFGGTSWQVDQVLCGPAPRDYYPDVFSGVIDPEIDEFQSVNNDGGPMVNYPTVFRRVSCGTADEPPEVVTEPPAFYPETGGCGCGPF